MGIQGAVTDGRADHTAVTYGVVSIAVSDDTARPPTASDRALPVA